MTLWTVISFALLAILCCASLSAALIAVRIARHTTALPHQKLHSIESRLLSIESIQTDQGTAIEQVANRVKMQRVRNAANHVSDPPIADGSLKDQLRKRAGLTAGKPPRHDA